MQPLDSVQAKDSAGCRVSRAFKASPDVGTGDASRDQPAAYPLLGVADELGGPQDGAPPLELVHPVVQRALGHDDHVRPRDTPVLVQVAQQRDCLQGLAQALRSFTAVTHGRWGEIKSGC